MRRPCMRTLSAVPASLGLTSLPLSCTSAHSRCVQVYDGLLQEAESTSHLDGNDFVASYELRDLPGRRLRRWPRGHTGSLAVIWPVLEPQRWPWDD